MSAHYDKTIQRAQDAQAPAAPLPAWERENRVMTRDEVRSYLAGFGLRGSALVIVTQTWVQDQVQARSDGYDDGYDAGYGVGYGAGYGAGLAPEGVAWG